MYNFYNHDYKYWVQNLSAPTDKQNNKDSNN